MKCCNDIYPSLDLVRWSVCQSMDIKSPDMSDYYNKEETDELLDNKLDVSAYTPTDLEDYYTKDEIDAGFDTVNNELANKLDASAYTPTDLSQYWTSAETAAVIEDNEYVISQAINELKDTKQDALVSGENIKTINGISLVGEGDIQIGSGGTGATYSAGTNISIDTANTINCTLPIFVKGNQNNSLSLGSDTNTINNSTPYVAAFGQNNNVAGYQGFASGYGNKTLNTNEATFGKYSKPNYSTSSFGNAGNTLFTIGNGTGDNDRHNAFEVRQNGDIYITSGGTDIKLQDHLGGGTTDLSNYYTKSETNDLLDDKLDASAYTPTDLSGYWTSGETQEAINAATSGIPSSQTIDGLRSDLNALSGDVYTNYYTKSQVDALIAALQAQIDDLSDCCSGSGDTGSTEGKKYVLHHNGNEYSMACNSSSTLSIDDIDLGSGTYLSRTGTTDITIGDCVTTIGAMAMQYYSAMTSCTISSSVTTIEYQAFDGCNALTSLTIPDGVTSIPLFMCRNCWNLSTTNIPDGVTAIREGAYLDCLSLMNITIPSTVTVIGNNAFRTSSWTSSDPTKYQKMQNIATGRTVTILATTPPTLGDGVFGIQTGSGDIATYPIYVPANSVNAYKTAWSQYANRIFAIE